MILVKAGAAVDSFIDLLVPLLDAGDIIIDGGEKNWGQTYGICSFLVPQRAPSCSLW